ncbi:ubiquitin carboxyl-terminal hydrolase 28 isoform X1 [Ranitomeya imitator]|uniref:ubiquitin carboxyl-terminal hydrolase 28 isoform X1 n=1 Tax=Ranitomeya imitator TaxID=111125 RepID=UPI0037E92B96
MSVQRSGTRGVPGDMTGDNGAAERQPGEEAAEKRDSAPDSCTAKVDITAQVDDECAGIGCCDCASQDRDMLVNQLREITGIHNPGLLREALRASNDDVIEAVSILTDACESDPKVLVTKPSNPEECDTVVQDADSTIDSSCETDYLQKAIALSLQDVKNQQKETSDSSRSNDLYNLDNKSRSKRKRCEVWGDVPNPNELRRSGDWPVGLKNIGNTCWFNVVMQSLFHLPEFRRLVHGYRISPNIVDRCRTRNENRNIAFMHELQYLFALMVGSNKKYVDPTAALDLLKDAFLSEEAQQQDISEFSHKLLEWLEDAFQLTIIGERTQDKTENPMVQLFYGTFLTEGYLEDKTFSNTETFGQYPLQVNGFKNLNECLESITVEGEIEPMQNGRAMQYRQERWFINLPPVLTFELSRFEYNQSLGQPEKIHNKLEFPEIIYMDRFLFKNKDLIRRKREEIKTLAQDIDLLNQKLERYLKYGSGSSHCSLPDMLRYVLEFASTKSAAGSPAAAAMDSAGLSADDSSSCDTQPQEKGLIDITCNEQLDSDSTIYGSSTETASSLPSQQSHSAAGNSPAPRTITMEELQSVEVCLQRWKTEVEQDMQDLQNSIAQIRKNIEEAYQDPELLQVPYRLHAVLVHEGQANAGHYWTYIYSHTRHCWLKYNDISVTEATWEELKRDSYGGVRNASAYCLMYINNKLPYLIEDLETGQLEDKIRNLPGGFSRWIRDENLRFDQEVAEWEEAHSCKIPQMEPPLTCEEDTLSGGSTQLNEEYRQTLLTSSMSIRDQTDLAIKKTADCYKKNGVEAALEEPSDPEPEEAGEPEPTLCDQTGEKEPQPSSQISEVEIPTVGKILVRADADGYNEEMMLCPAMQGVILAILQARQVFDRDGPEAGLVKAFREEYSRLHELSKELPSPSRDPRLQHMLVYLFQNQAPKRIIERTLLEQFADRNLSYDERSISIMQMAQAKLKEIGPNDMDMKDYQKWHEDYNQFLKVSIFLMTGLELYQNKKYQEALVYLMYAYQSNSALLSIGANRGMDEKLLGLFRRRCLVDLSKKASTLFESRVEDQICEAISIMNNVIIPCVHLIGSNKASEEDLAAVEEMRSSWCSYLIQDMDENLQHRLGQFLPRLLDCSSDVVILKEPPKIRPHSPYDLCSRFAAIMESIHGASTVKVT